MARKAAVAKLGKELSRRAKNRCELCEESTSLKVVEIEPLPEEPEHDRAIIICDSCEEALTSRKGPSDQMRFLESVVWSETLPVQLTAERLLRTLSDRGVDWSRDTLENLYLPEEVEALL